VWPSLNNVELAINTSSLEDFGVGNIFLIKKFDVSNADPSWRKPN